MKITEMPAELEKRFKEIIPDPTLEHKLAEIINEAGSEFRFLFCSLENE